MAKDKRLDIIIMFEDILNIDSKEAEEIYSDCFLPALREYRDILKEDIMWGIGEVRFDIDEMTSHISDSINAVHRRYE